MKFSSDWTPEVPDQSLSLFIKVLRKDLFMNKAKKHRVKPNLTNCQLKSIQDLAKDPDIVIKKADKGNAIVIMDTKDYLYEGFRQLSDTNFYQAVEYDLTPVHETKVNRLVQSLFNNKLITKRGKRHLWAEHCTTARFYLLPKIHKKSIPGRPIVSANNCPTENLSAFVDAILNPLVKETKSYLRDTTDFIGKISDITLTENSLIATCDVVSLYTNINTLRGLTNIAKILRNRRDLPLPANRILEILRVVLTCNNFEFNGSHYLQVQGVSMGTKCAPTYANLVLSVIESEFLNTLTVKPLCWYRFIDDIFTVFDGSSDELKELVHNFNQLDPSIKLTLEYSAEKIAFLDTVVYRAGNKLHTSLYKKPTDTTNYLMSSSAHPPGCFKGFKSQAIRVRRNCTDLAEYDKHISPLKEAYGARGYDKNQLERTVTEIRQIDRPKLFNKQQPNIEQTDTPLVCTIPHNKRNTNARAMILKYWHIIQNSYTIGHLFPKPPTFGYFRPKNFKDLLCRARIRYPPNLSATAGAPLSLYSDCCDRVNCPDCNRINTRKHFTSSVTKEKFRKTHDCTKIDCQTTNVVYLITCTQCMQQYVGETKRVCTIRWKEHARDVKNKRDTPLASHFWKNQHDFQQAHLEILDTILGNPDSKNVLSRRLDKETHWIITLKTLHPLGINGRLGRPIST